MKKLLSLALVLILAFSMVFVAGAANAEDTIIQGFEDFDFSAVGSLENFDIIAIISEMISIENLTSFMDANTIKNLTEWLNAFFLRFDVWVRAFGVFVNGLLGGIFAGA